MAGNIISVEITDLNHEGQGVGRIDGKAVFVDGALPGETCEVRVTRSKKSYSTAEIVNIVKKSPDRSEPFCKSFEACGGCGLQHLDYEAQLKYKTNVVRESLKRIGKIEDAEIKETIGMKNPFNYRNKAQFPVGIIAGKPACGFYSKRSHDISKVEECGIQDPISLAVNEAVLEYIKANKLRVYEEKAETGLIRHIITRTGFATGEVMVVLVINGDDVPEKEMLIEMLKEKIEGVARQSVAVNAADAAAGGSSGTHCGRRLMSVFLNINKSNTNVIFGKKNVKIIGEDKITDYIGKFKFGISPTSFFQVNPTQTELMYNKVIEYAGLAGVETVMDVYCGIGTISIFAAEKAKKVIGIESMEEAVRDARQNALLNGIKNVEFLAGEAEVLIPQLLEDGIKPDIVIVDPPRKGVDEKVLSAIAEMSPKKIIYVSCNPSTLARDLRFLEDSGFKTIEAQPIDMFPWTGHVESVVLMSRVKVSKG